MKKQVSAILAASMAASMLVACGGSTSSAATSTATAESTSTASSEAAPAESTADAGQAADITPVSYTHLTLPTKRIVEISADAETKQKKERTEQ